MSLYDPHEHLEQVREELFERRRLYAILWLAQYSRSLEHRRVRTSPLPTGGVLGHADLLALADAEQFVCLVRGQIAQHEAACLARQIAGNRDAALKKRLRDEKNEWLDEAAAEDARHRRLREEPLLVLSIHDDLLEPGYRPEMEFDR